MFKINSCLVLAMCVSNIFAEYIMPPGCIKNYNTYLDKIENESLIENITVYQSISGRDCSNYCNNNSLCTSFNYYPNVVNSNMQSRCTLIKSAFNNSLLIDKFDAAFYVKGNNDCSSEERNNIILIVVGSILLVILLVSCCACSKRNRDRYSRI